MAENKPAGKPLRQNSAALTCDEFAQLASQTFETRITLRGQMRMLWHQFKCIYCRRLFSQFRKIHSLLSKEGQEKPMPQQMKKNLEENLRDLP